MWVNASLVMTGKAVRFCSGARSRDEIGRHQSLRTIGEMKKVAWQIVAARDHQFMDVWRNSSRAAFRPQWSKDRGDAISSTSTGSSNKSSSQVSQA
jgi:hypothetical protein